MAEKKNAAQEVKATPDDGMMEVRLLRDDQHKEPQFVGVNGKGYLVERGKRVKVPKEVYEVLMNAEDQAVAALDYQDSKVFREA